jgi:predicted  nucleic acid-binding Zn-ribbon protein
MGKDYSKIISELKTRIQRISQENAKIEGGISAVTKKMKKDYGIETIEEARKMVTKLNGEISEMVEEVDSEIYKIREILDGYEE